MRRGQASTSVASKGDTQFYLFLFAKRHASGWCSFLPHVERSSEVQAFFVGSFRPLDAASPVIEHRSNTENSD
jgi:hypothetical protein